MNLEKFLIFLSLLFSTLSCSSDDGDNSGQSSDITLTCSVDRINASVAGGSYTMDVSNSRGDWTAYADDNCNAWVTVNVTGSTSKQGQVTVTIAPNTGTSERNGDVIIKSGVKKLTIPVEQTVPMQISQNTIHSVSAGESVLVGVACHGDYSAKSNASWITVEKVKSVTIGSTTYTDGIRITTSANTSMESRTETVDVISGEEKATITVIQNSVEDTEIDTPEGYRLIWNDEFNEGTTLGHNWTHEVQGPGWVNNELQTYVNGQADGKRVTELVDGRLHINCFKENGKIYSGRVYAKVNEGWQYGYFEAKIKLPKGKGTWPAFWMMPVGNDWNTNPWPMCGEIDIMEEVGCVPNEVSSSIHTQDYNHTKNTQKTHAMTIANAEGEFHVYAIEWTEDKITTYVDGQVQLAVTKSALGSGHNQWPFHYAFYPILNLAWGGSWGGMNGVDESALPVTMEVDYIRVFQKQ